MGSMILFLITFTLLMAFVAVVWLERKRDQKFFVVQRERFDAFVQKQYEEIKSLDIIEALEYIVRYIALQVSHVVVAVLHFIARRVERVLRKARRRLHQAKPSEEPSHFVKAMREVKESSE